MRKPSAGRRHWFWFFLFVFFVCFVVPPSASAEDWYSWRGPENNGVSREKDLPDKFSLDEKAEDSNLVWQAPYGCRSTPIVMKGRVYVINHAGDDDLHLQERVMCLDADTGKVVWEHKYNVFFSDVVKVRLGWTSPVGDPETGHVYVHGTGGQFFCFDRNGKIVWKHSMTEEYGRITGYGGRIVGPAIDGDLVILGMLNASWGDLARGGNRWVAWNKRTGAVVWWASSPLPPKNTYSSTPVVGVIAGQRLVITGSGVGAVHAFKARTGELVWTYPLGTGAVNLSGIIDGDLIYIGQGKENPDNNIQGRFVCLDGSKVKAGKPKLVWKVDGIRANFASPALHGGRLYICDDSAKILCLDAKTGKQLWKFSYGRNAKGSPVWADGKLYLADTNGGFHIIDVRGQRPKRLARVFLRDTEINGNAAVANGKVYFGTDGGLYCIGKKNHKAGAVKIPAAVKEAPADPDAKPAHLQVLPADVVVHPGEKVTFKVRAFDANGRFLKEASAKWALPVPKPPPMTTLKPPALRGTISEEGMLLADPKVPAQQGLVAARALGLTGLARVRVAPTLPYKQDFQKVPVGAPVGGWVNCAGKFVVEEKDGVKVLKKTALLASPLVARANTFIGLPTMSNYTIAADVMGGRKGDDLPDMGVVANRYTLMLAGNTQQLRLVCWDAIPRVDKSIGFPWKSGVWYRVKLTVELNGSRGVVRGKVWKRGEEEPNNWTVEFTDPIPNKRGSPALYGYATGILPKDPGASSYYANVSVTPNEKGKGQ
jgi:outer membrane protein assembly factor BamB